MATYYDSGAGLNVLADAAAEAESSQSDNTSESETLLSTRDRAPSPGDTATELRQLMSEMSATFSRQMESLSRRMETFEQDHRPPSLSHTSRSRDSSPGAEPPPISHQDCGPTGH